MRQLLFTLCCFTGLGLSAQNQAWYAGSRGANLFLVEITGDTCTAKEQLVLGDSVRAGLWSPYALSTLPFVFNSDCPYLDHDDWTVTHSLTNVTHSDSLVVNGKTYTIHRHVISDGIAGGRPNTTHQHVSVSDIGVLYSTDWLDQHILFMVCHEDPAKQRVIRAVYQHLATLDHWSPWPQLAALAGRYSFGDCMETLTAEWMATGDDLELVSCSYEKINDEFQAKATIRNISDHYYALPQPFSIAPLKVTVLHEDNGTTVDWDLSTVTAGEYVRPMDQHVYLAPGEEVHFSYVLPVHYEGNKTALAYSGFQVVSSHRYHHWLLQDPVQHDDQAYVIFPRRQIAE